MPRLRHPPCHPSRAPLPHPRRPLRVMKPKPPQPKPRRLPASKWWKRPTSLPIRLVPPNNRPPPPLRRLLTGSSPHLRRRERLRPGPRLQGPCPPSPPHHYPPRIWVRRRPVRIRQSTVRGSRSEATNYYIDGVRVGTSDRAAEKQQNVAASVAPRTRTPAPFSLDNPAARYIEGRVTDEFDQPIAGVHVNPYGMPVGDSRIPAATFACR